MSIVTNRFPQIVFKEGQKHLWNPIQKKALKNRPEERVRLRVIEYLLEAGWSKHRISTEEGIASPQKGKLRADLICYTKDFNPFLLVECKSNAVNISGQTADQIALYNKQIKADYLLMTNGLSDFWYGFEDKSKPVSLDEIPKPFHSNHHEKRTFEYWAARGFEGREAAAKLRKWLNPILNRVYQDNQSIRYLKFKKKIYELDLNHYYRVFSFDESRIALAFLATAFGDSRLIAIQNKDGKNRAVMEINLDLLFKGEAQNSSLYNDKGKKNINIEKELDWSKDKFDIDLFTGKLNGYFER